METLGVLATTPEMPRFTSGFELPRIGGTGTVSLSDYRGRSPLCQVTKRKISGGTRNDRGRDCRDSFLGLAKTCGKLGITFWDYLGEGSPSGR